MAAVAAAVVDIRSLGGPYHVACALLDQARCLAELGEFEAAETARAEACEIAERLGARPLLDRANEALPSAVS